MTSGFQMGWDPEEPQQKEGQCSDPLDPSAGLSQADLLNLLPEVPKLLPPLMSSDLEVVTGLVLQNPGCYTRSFSYTYIVVLV